MTARLSVALVAESITVSDGEAALLARSAAAALSRSATLAIWLPENNCLPYDGAFNPKPLPIRSVNTTSTPIYDLGAPDVIALLHNDQGAISQIESLYPTTPQLLIGGSSENSLSVTTSATRKPDLPYLPINPMALTRRHNALAETTYILVLDSQSQDDLVNWCIAGFPEDHLLIVRDGVAHIWHLRSPIGSFSVDTRTDLWRLMAHASVTVDLSPGNYFGRECVDSLLVGTAVIIPKESGAQHLTSIEAARSFESTAQLLDAIGTKTWQQNAVEVGSAYVRSTYGDPQWVVDSCAKRLAAITS
jgi:hypothetical protein